MQTNTTPPARRDEPEQEQTPPAAKRDWLSSLRSWFKRKEKPFDPEKAVNSLARLHSYLTNSWLNWPWKLAYFFKKLIGWLFIGHWWTFILAVGLTVCGWYLASGTKQYHSLNLGELTQVALFLLVLVSSLIGLALVVRELLLRSPYLLEFKVSDPSLRIEGLSPEGFSAMLEHRLHQIFEKTEYHTLSSRAVSQPIVSTDGPGVEFEVAGRTQNLRHLLDSLRRLLGIEGRRITLTLQPQGNGVIVSLSNAGKWTQCININANSNPKLDYLIDSTLEALILRIDPLLLLTWWSKNDILMRDKKESIQVISRHLLSKNKSKADGWLFLARVALLNKDWDSVLDFSSKSLRLQPNKADSIFARAYAFNELSETITDLNQEKIKYLKEAINGYAAFLKINGLQKSSAWNNWGYLLRQLGKFDEAIRKYKYATSINQAYAKAYYGWGVALKGNNETGNQDALEKFKEARRIAEIANDLELKSMCEALIKQLDSYTTVDSKKL